MLYELRVNLLLAVGSSVLDPVSVRSLDYLTRHVKAFAKMFRTLQHTHQKEFIALPMSNDLVLYYWSTVVQASQGSRDLVAGIYHLGIGAALKLIIC